MQPNQHTPRQQGATLLVTLVLLIGTTVASLASLNIALMEQKMAGVEEARMVSFNEAQAIVDAITDPSQDHIAVTSGGVGTRNCTSNYVADPGEGSCTTSTISLLTDVFGSEHSAHVERISPEYASLGRTLKTTAISGLKVANFGVQGRMNALSSGGGRTRVSMGYLKVFVEGSGETVIID